MKNRETVLRIARIGVIASLYIVLTLAFAPISYGPVQFRIAEAMMILPIFFPEAVWALTIGCLVSNLASYLGVIDVIFGTSATLVAALITSRMKNKFLAPIPTVICNGIVVGAVITYIEAAGTGTEGLLTAFAYNFLTVSAGEAVVCWALGVPLAAAVEKTKLIKKPDKKSGK